MLSLTSFHWFFHQRILDIFKISGIFLEFFLEFFGTFLDNFFGGMFMEDLNIKWIDLFVKILFLSRFCLKAEFWQANLVCLLEFWFVCQNFGLFVSILVCLPAFWFVCQHFGLFASILVNQNANKQTNLTKQNKI